MWRKMGFNVAPFYKLLKSLRLKPVIWVKVSLSVLKYFAEKFDSLKV